MFYRCSSRVQRRSSTICTFVTAWRAPRSIASGISFSPTGMNCLIWHSRLWNQVQILLWYTKRRLPIILRPIKWQHPTSQSAWLRRCSDCTIINKGKATATKKAIATGQFYFEYASAFCKRMLKSLYIRVFVRFAYRSASASPRRKRGGNGSNTRAAAPDPRELNESKAAHDCLLFLIKKHRELFTVSNETLQQCTFTSFEESVPVSFVYVIIL